MIGWERKGSLFVPTEEPPVSVTAIEPPPACPHCGGPFAWGGLVCEKTVGHYSPPGHDHDDNCLTRSFHCVNGHLTRGSIQRSCSAPGCEWKGKVMCCGYNGGPKWTRWPIAKMESQA
jgi:hypothetical protein